MSPGWAEGTSAEKLTRWNDKGMELKSELEKVSQEVFTDEYNSLMRKVLVFAGLSDT